MERCGVAWTLPTGVCYLTSVAVQASAAVDAGVEMPMGLEHDKIDDRTEPSIGPHEGRELELMLSGRKPLALFYAIESEIWILPEEQFDRHVEMGKFVKADFLFKPISPAAPVVKCVLYPCQARRHVYLKLPKSCKPFSKN